MINDLIGSVFFIFNSSKIIIRLNLNNQKNNLIYLKYINYRIFMLTLFIKIDYNDISFSLYYYSDRQIDIFLSINLMSNSTTPGVALSL